MNGVAVSLLGVSRLTLTLITALDNTIISTAIPKITDEFKAINDVGWYGSAYLLTTCAFQLFFGKLYTFLSLKYTYLVALVIFEIGSAVCGAAPNSTALIIGRAVAGLGSAGIFSGAVSATRDPMIGLLLDRAALTDSPPDSHRRQHGSSSQASNVYGHDWRVSPQEILGSPASHLR